MMSHQVGDLLWDRKACISFRIDGERSVRVLGEKQETLREENKSHYVSVVESYRVCA